MIELALRFVATQHPSIARSGTALRQFHVVHRAPEIEHTANEVGKWLVSEIENYVFSGKCLKHFSALEKK